MPPPNSFTRLKGVTTNAAIAAEDQLKNVRENIKLKIPRFQDIPEFNKVKGFNKKIALVGGGPSLKLHLKELKEFRAIIACGSVHDYLISNNIIPTYAANCDPDDVCANYFTKADTEVKYLISSNSSSKLFKLLEDKQVILWHCHSEEQQSELIELEGKLGNAYQAVGGGCTVGLRSISLALCMGYGNLHFFGFDSCMAGEDGRIHHAYEWSTPEEKDLIDKVYCIRLGPESGPTDKGYFVAGYQLAQLENFKDFYGRHKDYFKPTFHGGGALSDFLDLMRQLESKDTELRHVA